MPDADPAPVEPATVQARLVQYRPQIQRHIRAMVRDTDEAEDLTQDTYARALQRVDQLRDPEAGLAWLYRIATSVTLDRLRQHRPSTIPLDSPAVSAVEAGRTQERPGSLIETALERIEMSECVQHYLETLSDDYRVAILLHDVHGLTNPQIARLVGCSLATAKIRVYRARRRLRETLDAACMFDIDERGVLVCEPLLQLGRPNLDRES